jgi:hypothetical protein
VPLKQRLQQIEGQAEQLVTAARQLELSQQDLAQLIERNWERQNGK